MANCTYYVKGKCTNTKGHCPSQARDKTECKTKGVATWCALKLRGK